MKSRNIGIVTWYKSENYGTNLQAYALYKYIEDIGFNSYLINEFQFAHFGLKYQVLNILQKLNLQSFVKKHIGKANNRKRLKKAVDFFDKYTKIKYVYNKARYNCLLQDIDTFITGSDQIWNPNYLVPFYLLDFAGDNKRIAYSSSIGVSQISKNCGNYMKPFLQLFDALGLREQTGVTLVNNLIDMDRAIQVVDPTLLLSKDSWQKVADTSNLSISMDYVFCYLIGNRPNYAEEIADVVIKSGLKKVHIVHSIENPNFSVQIEGVDVDYPVADGIEDFLYLLSHATYVCTDSFHATAISLKFHKQFVELMRFSSDDPKSQNSRINDILGAYEVLSQIYDRDWVSIPVINYKNVERLLQRDICKSEQFLLNALNS